MQEIWKDIQGYEGYYQVSNLGKVKSLRSNTILKIIKEKGEFDFEVSAMVEELTQEEYEELKSMLITAIGTMELMRRNKEIK